MPDEHKLLLNEKQPNRWWVFTVNNPINDDYKQLDLLVPTVDYLCYGHEISKTNTPHLQGYLELSKPQRFSWLKKRIPRAYLAIRLGARTQARDYCFKECSNSVEYGTFKPDKQGQRNELLACKKMIDAGRSMYDISQEHFSTFLRYERSLIRYQNLLNARKPSLNEPITCIWIYGPTGSGKSKYAAEKYPDAYRKPNNKWWDAYDSQDTVIWDDFSYDKQAYTYQDLLLWTDRYKKTGETKGGTVPLVYKTIVFTSIHPPSFDNQFIRRFNDGANITPVTSLHRQDVTTI
jgi:hypothetical protein